MNLIKTFRTFCFISGLLIGIHIFSLGIWDKYSSYNQETRACLHELKEQQSVDILFLGASHIFYGINPYIVDEKLLGLGHSFDASTMSQRPIDSYFLLKYALESGIDVSSVVYDVNYTGFQKDGDVKEGTWPLLRYIDCFSVKTEYAIASGSWYYVLDDLSALRYKEKWKNLKIFMSNLKGTVFDTDYRNYVVDTVTARRNERYMGRGYIYSERQLTNYDYKWQVPWTEENISEESVYYFERLLQLCEENRIPIILISVPVHKEYIRREPYYDNVAKFITSISNRYGLEYWNFQDKLDDIGLTDEDFIDVQHLNGNGASKFTNYVCSFFEKRGIISKDE